MRKLVLLAILVLALAALTAGIASAAVNDEGNPHGGYSITTGKCAACHRAHTAEGAALLKASSPEALCESCHGGAGANTNVWAGMYGTDPTQRLNGGGFETIGGIAATSQHSVGFEGTAWGGTVTGDVGKPGYTAAGISGLLECTSCHNPHGSTNYRILNDSDMGYNASLAWMDPSGDKFITSAAVAWQKSQVLATNNQFVTTIGVNNPGTPLPNKYVQFDVAQYTQGVNNFCASCHKTYLTRSGSAETPSTSTATGSDGLPIHPYADPGATTAQYRHATSRSYSGAYTPSGPQFALRFSALGNNPDDPKRTGFTCLTCHFAHGTTAASTGYAATVGNPTGGDSALLYYPNRGVCNSCHQKAKTTTTLW